MATKLKSGVRGAALTAFSASGYVEGTASLRNIASSSSQQKETQQGEFAPMTPHTRKQATASLSSTNTLDRLATVRGSVRTAAVPSLKKSSPDEALVLWVGSLEHVCVVPAVSRFWEAQLNKGSNGGGGVNLFSGSAPTRMIKLADLATGLLGEPCCGVDLIPLQGGGPLAEGMAVEVVIRGESRLVIARDGDESGSKKLALRRPRRLFSKERPNAIIVHGENKTQPKLSFNLSTAKAGSLRLKSAAFSADQDYDMDDEGTSLTAATPSRPRVGFDFANTLSAAADETADISCDVEAEMLGIMEIDQALESMNGTPTNNGHGQKRVFFED
ncbi:hypothetical protein PWT90_09230 [Aphanocladium album]|nr:hypothetical protein PWT90_09230 [Aphanocladium album]